MSLVAARLYRNGREVRRFATIADIAAHAGGPEADAPDSLLWVGLAAPDAAEMAALGQALALHPLAVEDAVKAHQLPKLETYDRHLFIIARTASVEGEALVFGETAIFAGRRFIVTARHGSARDHGHVREALEAAPDLLAQGSDRVLHAILDKIVDDYGPALDALEAVVDAREEAAFKAMPDAASVRRLFALRRTLTRFDRLVEPMAGVLGHLALDDLAPIDAPMRPYFRDIADHIGRALHQASDLRDTLMTIVETGSILEQQRQGDITRRLAAWAGILAVPTAIAGIYGMNFAFMPELQWRWGYPTVLGVIAVACATLYWRFRRSGWL